MAWPSNSPETLTPVLGGSHGYTMSQGHSVLHLPQWDRHRMAHRKPVRVFQATQREGQRNTLRKPERETEERPKQHQGGTEMEGKSETASGTDRETDTQTGKRRLR